MLSFVGYGMSHHLFVDYLRENNQDNNKQKNALKRTESVRRMYSYCTVAHRVRYKHLYLYIASSIMS